MRTEAVGRFGYRSLNHPSHEPSCTPVECGGMTPLWLHCGACGRSRVFYRAAKAETCLRSPNFPRARQSRVLHSSSGLLGLWILVLSLCAGISVSASEVTSVPDSIRRGFNLSQFYQKYVDGGGLPVVGSTNVTDYALREAAWIVERMLEKRPDVLQAMATNKTRLAVMAYTEYTSDIPEHSRLQSRVFWDRRARGLGATPRAPAVSCGEENLLCLPGDPYSTENICIHEFSHAIHEMGMSKIDPTFDGRLRKAHQSATNAGLWKGTYAYTTRHEYWAEGVQCWFDNNRENDSLHNHVNTRAELKDYDKELASLCHEVFGEIPWRYLKPMERKAADRAHLAGYDFTRSPRFRWRKEPVPEKPRVRIQTEIGDIEVELVRNVAPFTVTNFLNYVHEGFYSDGRFHRTVTLSNQPANKVKIEVIQAAASSARTNEFLPPIRLERTRDTDLKHVDGTLSMARDGPDSAQDEFFICIGDQPELDFGGKRNPDGQGFAAFGKVTKGMDVVRRIQSSPAEEQSLKPPIRIQRAVRLN
jgi:cyclophilin family peptidyl-prolyl cis-trans isomerase